MKEALQGEAGQAIHIGFDGQQVTVRSNVPEVHERVRRRFSAMTEPSAGNNIATLDLNRTDSGFVLKGPGFIPLHRAVVDELAFVLTEEVPVVFMRQRPDLLWLHAGAVEREGKATLILGASGQGKSTLVTLLCQRGWKLMSDDLVPISMSDDIAYPFPQQPSRRIPSAAEWGSNALSTIPREVMSISADEVARTPSLIERLIFLRYVHGARSSLLPLTKGEAALEMVRGSTNFHDHRANGVRRSAVMVGNIPAYRLEYGIGNEAAQTLANFENG